MPIKYLGSKRRLVPLLVRTFRALRSEGSVLDLFSGTSRVGHALKRAGFRVVANDANAYAEAIARGTVVADRHDWNGDAARWVARLEALPPREGWFTETYCRQSRYLTPENGARLEAMRDALAEAALPAELESVLLVSLLEAADRVDSTTGVQMAYLKAWAPRARRSLALRLPDLLPRASSGKAESHRLDALEAIERLEADVAYLDPPYNQHSYLGNYHVWETLVLWDAPEVYGIARKRVDCRTRKSVFNRRSTFPDAWRRVVERVRAEALVVSMSDEGFVSRAEMESLLARRGEVWRIDVDDHPRYVGAKIGIHNLRGEKVGTVGRLKNTESVFVAGRFDRAVRRRLLHLHAKRVGASVRDDVADDQLRPARAPGGIRSARRP